MEFALVLRELRARWRLVAPGLVLAVIAAVLSVYRLDGLKLKPRSLQRSAATTQVFVDTPRTVLGDVTQAVPPLLTRATVYANFMASPTMLRLIGQRVGIGGDQISAAGPIDPSQPRTVTEPTALKRNFQLTGETNPFQLQFSNDPNLPLLGIYAQAPTTGLAIQLANAAAASLASYVSTLQAADRVAPRSRVVIRQLGSPNGGVVNGGTSKTLFVMVFGGVVFLWCVLVLVGARFRRIWRESQIYAGANHPSSNGAGSAAPPRRSATDSDGVAPWASANAILRARFSHTSSHASHSRERLRHAAPDTGSAEVSGLDEGRAHPSGQDDAGARVNEQDESRAQLNGGHTEAHRLGQDDASRAARSRIRKPRS